MFRAWVRRAAHGDGRGGLVDPAGARALRDRRTSRAYQAVRDLTVVDPPAASRGATCRPTPAPRSSRTRPAARLRRAPAAGGIEPLHQFTVVNRGLDETVAGLPAHRPAERAGERAGDRQPDDRRGARSSSATSRRRTAVDPRGGGRQRDRTLERADVTGRLRSVGPVVPGTPWGPPRSRARAGAHAGPRPQRALVPAGGPLRRARPRPLPARASPTSRSRRAAGTRRRSTTRSSTWSPPSCCALTWVETAPADLPDRAARRAGSGAAPGGLDDALDDRELLESSLDAGVIAAARGGRRRPCRVRAVTETQGQHDAGRRRAAARRPRGRARRAPTGCPDAGGVFDVTDFDDSTFR